MNVVYYSSDFFSEMCAVSMESLCENNKESKEININIIEDNISEKNKNKLKEITDAFSRRIIFIRMPTQSEVYPDVHVNLGRTYARMILGNLLPESVERVISCDSDTIVMDSLEEMCNIDLEGNIVAGVYDCVGKAIQENVLHANKTMKYCNAGMFLIDLKAWREKKIGDKLLKCILEANNGKRQMYFLEQDIMNIVLEGNVKLLDPRYNLLTSIYIFDYDELIKMKRPVLYYSRKEIDKAKSNPAILHATTCFYVRKRMWVINSDHPYRKIYIDFRSRTPWRNYSAIKDGRKLSKKIYAEFWHCMPKAFAIFLAAGVINFIRPLYAKIAAKISLPTIAKQSTT